MGNSIMPSIIRATTTSGLQVAPDNSGSLQLQTNGTTTAVTIDTSQNVGIGTTSPVNLLTVESTSNVRATIRNSTETTSYGSSLDFATGSGSLSSTNVVGRVVGLITQADPSTLQSALTFHTNSGDNVSEKMRIDSSGNVGIGTTPSAWNTPLKVMQTLVSGTWSNSSASSAFYSNVYRGASYSPFYITTNVAGELGFNLNGAGEWTFSNAPSGTAGTVATLTERMRIDSSGNVLVGTTTQANNAKLTVLSNDSIAGGVAVASSGSLYRQMYLSNTGTVLQFWNGSNQANLSAAGAWTNSSDERLKKNIVDIKYGLNTVLTIKPRSFERKDVEGEYVGFIAQELLPIIPEVVNGEEETQYCVDYGSLVAVAFKAIQEQQTIINDLKARIETLEAK